MNESHSTRGGRKKVELHFLPQRARCPLSVPTIITCDVRLGSVSCNKFPDCKCSLSPSFSLSLGNPRPLRMHQGQGSRFRAGAHGNLVPTLQLQSNKIMGQHAARLGEGGRNRVIRKVLQRATRPWVLILLWGKRKVLSIKSMFQKLGEIYGISSFISQILREF